MGYAENILFDSVQQKIFSTFRSVTRAKRIPEPSRMQKVCSGSNVYDRIFCSSLLTRGALEFRFHLKLRPKLPSMSFSRYGYM